MDPNATLAAMRQLSAEMRAWQDGDEDPDEPGEYYRIASEMVENFDAMDGWLSKRGFAPDAWTRPQSSTLAMEKRAYRLRCALLEAGVPENLVRAVELGGEERVELRTDAERRAQPEGLPQGVWREGPDL